MYIFEDLKTWMTIRIPTMLEFFVEGLKEDISHTVKLLNPFTMSQSVEKSRY